MVSTQSKFDMEYVYGEFGETYNIGIKNDDGTNADITWATAATLRIEKLDGTLLFEDTALAIASPNVVWTMTAAQTTAQVYTGEAIAQVILTNVGPNRKRLVKKFKVFIFDNIQAL